MASEIKYPNITVKLTGYDGNAFTLLAVVKRELWKYGVPDTDQTIFTNEAMSGDYDHLLQTIMQWVSVE